MSEEQDFPKNKPPEKEGEIFKAGENDPTPGTLPDLQPLTPQPSNMETHADHLHKIPGHGWKHYFFEFFMLFLAVSAGFFVENLREHYVENKREKEYAQSLYDDLKADTSHIQRTYDEKNWAVAKIDSLKAILDSSLVLQNNELVYYFERLLTKKDVFTAQDVTFQQLRGSGNLRYFRNLSLYKKIAGYYNFYDRYKELTEDEFGDAISLHELEAKLFNGADLNSLYNPEAYNYYTLFKRADRKLAPIKNDSDGLNQLNIRAGNSWYSIRTASWFLDILKKNAIKLIAEIKNEYNLE